MTNDLEHPLADPAAVQADSYGGVWSGFLDEWAALNGSVPDAAMLDRLEELVRRGQAPRALELGVGTGFLAIPLARRGIAVTGIDGSRGMLERLRANAADLPVYGVLADFTDFDLGESFAVVYFCSSSLYCLPNAEAQASCLRAAARHLDANGRFVIAAYLHDDAWYDENDDLEFVQSAGEGWRMQWSAHHVPAEQRALVTRTLHRDGEPDLLLPHQERYITIAQLDDMAARAGLALEERHADWQRRPFTGKGQHVSVYATRYAAP